MLCLRYNEVDNVAIALRAMKKADFIMPPSTPCSPRLRLWIAGLALVLLVLGSYFALAQTNLLPWMTLRKPDPFPTSAATRDGRWTQDVTYLAEQLTRLHPDPDTVISAEDFAAATQVLLGQIPTATDAEVVAGMMALVASIGDGHTALELYAPDLLHLFPLSLSWYGDDLIVVGAHPDQAAAIGGRVVQIGTRDPQAALAAVAPLIAHDNAQQLRQRSARFLVTPEILAAVGVLPDVETGLFVVETRAGDVVELTLTRVRVDEELAFQSIYEVLGEMPLRGQHPDRAYWYTYLPDQATIYFHYFRCADEPDNPFAGFNKEMFAFVDANPVRRVVVDLRFNGGGDSSILQPFIAAVRARPALNQPGGLYVLIGRQTFSSALMNAVELKTKTAAILLGEPTGGKPNHFGEVQTFSLPNSGLFVQYSTRRFITMPGNTADALAPDLAYPITWADLLAGRDPALDAALSGVMP